MLKTLASRKHVLCADQFVIAEARRNLNAKASAESLQALDNLLARTEVVAAGTGGVDSHLLVWLPDKDRPVLAAAIRMNCDALVTGDVTHFGSGFGKSFGGVVIYSPRLLAESVLI